MTDYEDYIKKNWEFDALGRVATKPVTSLEVAAHPHRSEAMIRIGYLPTPRAPRSRFLQLAMTKGQIQEFLNALQNIERHLRPPPSSA